MPTQAEIEAAAKLYLDTTGSVEDRIKAVLEAAEHARWQPIETAPKDGSHIVFYQPKEKYLDEGMIVGSFDGEFVSPAMVDGYDFECEVKNPTYWQHLPSPPETK